jgi:hypothetical protein
VRPRDDEGGRVARRRDELDERVRHGGHAQAAVDRRASLDVVAPAHVADDRELGRGNEVRRVESREAANAPPFELRADGRIEGDVRARYFVAHRREEPRERPHAGPRDADAMDAHDSIL